MSGPSWGAVLGAACMLALMLCWTHYPDQVTAVATAVWEAVVDAAGWVNERMHPAP